MKEEIGEWKLGIECNECGHLALASSKVPRVCPKCGALGAGVVEVPVRFRYTTRLGWPLAGGYYEKRPVNG